MSQSYTAEFKAQVIHEVQETQNATIVARRHPLSPSMVRRWSREVRQETGKSSEGLSLVEENAQLVFRMTQGLHTLQQSGQRLDAEALAALSPYRTAHVNRFGRYELDLTRQPPPVEYALLADLPTDHS